MIDEYIDAQDEAVKPLLSKLRETIHAAASGLTERIAWQMPTFWWHENVCHFAAFKKHIGIFPGDEAVAAFAPRLEALGLKYSKGTIQLPLNRREDGSYEDVSYELVSDIVKYRMEHIQPKPARSSRKPKTEAAQE
jgi:uncharacterized protein YdhG (YjbR/CyaY superfamily)